MSRSMPETQAGFSQQGPPCCTMKHGEPSRGHSTLGDRAHTVITLAVLHGLAIREMLSHQPAPTHSSLASVHNMSLRSSTTTRRAPDVSGSHLDGDSAADRSSE